METSIQVKKGSMLDESAFSGLPLQSNNQKERRKKMVERMFFQLHDTTSVTKNRKSLPTSTLYKQKIVIMTLIFSFWEAYVIDQNLMHPIDQNLMHPAKLK